MTQAKLSLPTSVAMRRNAYIAALAAFRGGKGTADMVEKAMDSGLKVFRFKEEDYYGGEEEGTSEAEDSAKREPDNPD